MRKICPDCHIPIPAGQHVTRSVSLQRVELCKPCAEDRGWTVPRPRRSLTVEVAEATARGIVEAERYANGVRR
jgi:sulfur relay (sulfurtransferase) complex TusBCD TusD component (DsrE family)